MKTITKKLKMFIVLFLGVLIYANGQDVPHAYVEDEPVRDHAVWLDSVFMNVNMERLSTNLLLDRSPGIHDLTLFDGQSDSNSINPYLFEGLYNTLYASCTDSLNPLADWDSAVEPYWKLNNSYYSANIGLLFFDFDRLKPYALDSGLLITDSLYLYDPVPLVGNPFEKKTLFAGALSRSWFDSLDVVFRLPSSLLFTNKGIAWDIEIDFGDGNGYIPISLGSDVIVSYPDTGRYTIDIKLTAGTTVYRTQTTANVRRGRRYDSEFFSAGQGKVFVVEAEETARGITHKAKATVTYAYGCGNTSLKKPFIVVPGINIPELIELNNGKNPGTYQAFINDLSNNDKSLQLKELLEREGYDLVYIEYHHGADWIQNNAKLVQTIIRMVNQEKTANGSTEPNVVYGESMGGVVARYALCEMEANNEMHDVEQFISFDAPHNGANVPLGAQALLAHLNDIQFRVAFIPVLKLNSFVPQLRIAEEAMKNNGAVKQLLIDYYFHVPKIGSTNARDVLMSELDAFGFPKQTSVRGNTIRNIILSNGSGAGAAGELFPSHAKMMDFESSMGILTSSFTSFLVFGFTGTGFRAHAEIWSVPVNNATPLTVYHGGYNASVLGVLLNVINNRWFKVENANGLDHLPGGTMESMPITPPNNIGLLTVYQPNFCFIPTISSCALLPPYRNNTTYNINANYNEVTNTCSNGESSVHLVILGRNNVTNSPENQFHISWNTSNSDFLIQHAFTAPRLEQTILSNLEFNYGGNSSKVLSSISLVNYSAIKINGNQAIGLSSNNPPLPKPTVGSHFEVHTNGQNCNAGKVTVSVFNNSSVIIGDNSVGNTGVLTIQPGDIIELYNGGSLKIADNSKLVIEEGAELVIHQGANILLEGEDAKIEILGKLRLQNGAVFNPQKGSASHVGYVHFIRPSGFTGNQIVAEGNTSSIQLTGSGKNNLLLKVEGGELQIPHPASNPGNYVASVAVTDGLIVVSQGSSLKCGSDIAYENVRTRGGGAGLVLCGQSNYSFLNTDFRELATGIQVINVYSDRMEFLDILFKNNSYAGIVSDQSSLILDNCSFYYNNQGVLIQSPAAESEITNSMFGFNATAVAQAGNGLLYIEETIILNANSGTGISFNTEQDDGGALVLACTKLYSNAVGIEAGVNTEINLSTSIASGTAPYYYGGNNSFWVNGNSIRLNTALLYLEDGYNNFIGEPSTGGSPPYHFVTGTIPDNITANIDATYNYWYPSPPGSDIIYGGADYFSIGNYSGAPPPHLTTIKLHGDILANVNSQCYEDPENTIWYIPLSRTMPEDGNPKPQPQTAFILYPNPVNDILVIETAKDKLNPTGIDNPEKNTIKSVELYDVQGKKLAKGSLNSGHWEISTQELAEGIYIVRVMTGNSVYNQYVRVLR